MCTWQSFYLQRDKIKLTFDTSAQLATTALSPNVYNSLCESILQLYEKALE